MEAGATPTPAITNDHSRLNTQLMEHTERNVNHPKR